MISADEARALASRYDWAKDALESRVKQRASGLRTFAIMPADEHGLSDGETARLCDDFRAAGFQVRSDPTGIEVSWKERRL